MRHIFNHDMVDSESICVSNLFDCRLIISVALLQVCVVLSLKMQFSCSSAATFVHFSHQYIDVILLRKQYKIIILKIVFIEKSTEKQARDSEVDVKNLLDE